MKVIVIFFIALIPGLVMAGPINDAAKAACVASGGADRFIIYRAGRTQTCSQVCSEVSCVHAATCVKGWTVWNGVQYQYGNECSIGDPSGIYNPAGKICCCTGTHCAQPNQFQAPFEY